MKDHLGNTRAVFNGTDLGGNIDMLQHSNYYPFGLAFDLVDYNTSTTSDYKKNKYLYNNKELQDDMMESKKLDWYDYGTRMYDPQLGRWHVMGQMAEKYYLITPYAYAANNPIRFIDSDGNKIVDANGNVIYTQQGGWSNNAPADAVRLGSAMMGTRTGTVQFNKMVNAEYGITLNISQENKISEVDGKAAYKLGDTKMSVSYDPNTGSYTVNSVDVTVYEGTLNEYLEESNSSKADAYRESTENNDQAIGATGAH